MMAVECGIQRQQLRTETANKGGLVVWLADRSRWIWELLLNGFFACESERIETLDEIIPFRRNGERSAHDGLDQPAGKGPQARELAPGRERSTFET